MFRCEHLSSSFSVYLEPSRTFSEASLQRVDELWQKALLERPFLRNGQLFSVHRIEGESFYGSFVEYKYWMAQRREPRLYEDLRIEPLAVTGVLRVGDELVFARRGSNVVQDAGLWELGPSGGVDNTCRVENSRLQVEDQLLTELHEELGLGHSQIEQIVPLGVALDLENHVRDLVFELRVALNAQQVHDAFKSVQEPEYTDLRFVPLKDMALFVDQNNSSLAPIAIEILNLRGMP